MSIVQGQQPPLPSDTLQQPRSTGTALPTSGGPFDIATNKDLYNQLIQHYRSDIQVPWAWKPNDQNIQDYTGQINNTVAQFQSQFENLVGRPPTSDETSKYVSQFVIPNTNNIGNNVSAFDVNSQTQQFIGQNYQKAAQEYATQQLETQKGQANDLADLFRTKGNAAISDVEQSLLGYQQKLFERLRPNLITSLHSQGLLNTGGMNEALAGQEGDLANEGAKYIADLKYQNDQAANDISFSGEAAPYYYAQGNITNNPATMAAAGQSALANNRGVFMSNLDYMHQLGLVGAQTKAARDSQPSFLRTFGQSAAQSLGSNFNIPSWISAARGGSSNSIPGGR